MPSCAVAVVHVHMHAGVGCIMMELLTGAVLFDGRGEKDRPRAQPTQSALHKLWKSSVCIPNYITRFCFTQTFKSTCVNCYVACHVGEWTMIFNTVGMLVLSQEQTIMASQEQTRKIFEKTGLPFEEVPAPRDWKIHRSWAVRDGLGSAGSMCEWLRHVHNS